MQHRIEHLKAQQAILKALGYYDGAIDGIWSTKTVEAKKKFEFRKEFMPGIPNSGLPFADQGPYPRGIYRMPDGSLTCAQVEAEKQKAAEKKAVVEESAKVEESTDKGSSKHSTKK